MISLTTEMIETMVVEQTLTVVKEKINLMNRLILIISNMVLIERHRDGRIENGKLENVF